MTPTVSSDAFNAFFAWAPWVVGLLIYLGFFLAKRHEGSTSQAAASTETFACAQCGRRGGHDQMVPQDHGGAVSYVCNQCATQEALA